MAATLGLAVELPPSVRQPLNRGPITLRDSFKMALNNAVKPARKPPDRSLEALAQLSKAKLLAARAAVPDNCSIPLLRAPFDNPEQFAIRKFKPSSADKMAMKPPAPACSDGGASGQK
ncbi:MAG: hypothetical protein JOZ62_14380 [Acidobacteriaceae bacterium]|nr:hypothetical protein [Acidobacteriaceae bacterium]